MSGKLLLVGPPYSFAASLKAHRRATGLTQEELAVRAGVSVRTISGLENGGSHRPYNETMRLLANALQLSGESYRVFLTTAQPAGESSTGHSSRCEVPAGGHPSERLPPAVSAPVSELIGRAEELAALGALLCRVEVRLLTLTGSPGVGKTRLAYALAAELAPYFADGVCFVEFAALTQASLVATTILHALSGESGSAADDEEALAMLMTSISERQMVLVLESFEHLLAATPLITHLLAACTHLKILVTSRTKLSLSCEHLFAVRPLALPADSTPWSLEELAQTAAVRLFLLRAQQVQPTFLITSSNRSAIAAICRRVDGLPLALELAAARLELLTPDELLCLLDDPLAVLTSGNPRVPRRQQTLRQTLDWSYLLLNPTEQRVFAHLAVFRGGMTFAAATSVISRCLSPEAPCTMLEAVTSLLHNNLLVQNVGDVRGVHADHAPRLAMLETTRAYAWEHSSRDHNAREAAQRAHASYYQQLIEATEQLVEPERVAALQPYEEDLENFRAALQWSATSNAISAVELGLRLATSLGPFWYGAGHLHEGVQWLRQLLVRADELENAAEADEGDEAGEGWATSRAAVRQRALHVLGWLLIDQGEYAQAAPLLRQSIMFYRHTADKVTFAGALNLLGIVRIQLQQVEKAIRLFRKALSVRRHLGALHDIAAAWYMLGRALAQQHDYRRAEICFHKSLALYRGSGDHWGSTVLLNGLADVTYRQRGYVRAHNMVAENLQLAQRRSDQRREALALAQLGQLAYEQGDYVQAASLWQQSLSLHRSLGDRYASAFRLLMLARLERAQGRIAQALGRYTEALTCYQCLSVTEGVMTCLYGLAEMAHAVGWNEQTAWLFGAVARLRRRIGTPRASTFGQTQALVRQELGVQCFSVLWQSGGRLTAEQAVTRALSMARELRQMLIVP